MVFTDNLNDIHEAKIKRISSVKRAICRAELTMHALFMRFA